ncbi:MAG: YgiQ family radical SAM protein [Clostridia bacterium]
MDGAFIPMTLTEMRELGIEKFDFILVSGDAYIDHPSFGPAIISRVIADNGYTIGIIAQPDFKSAEAFKTFGAPKLAFLVTSGNMDSMVNHYTVAKKRRSKDSYSPGGRTNLRPNRAVIAYSNRIREAFPGVPIIIGGIEASLRRFAHYDYWDDAVRRSVLFDSGADILVYGMGERQIIDIAEALESGLDIHDITYINGTSFIADSLDLVYDYDEINAFEEVKADKRAYSDTFLKEYEEQDPIRGRRIVQRHGDRFVIVNPPAMPLTKSELDHVYELPYMRRPHPSYKEEIPALSEVEFSLTSCRGCFGACSFCALTFHQGRIIQSRSHQSLIDEAIKMTNLPNFKGYIHDVGGPTANFRFPACKKQLESGTCKTRQCLSYKKCPNVIVNHEDYTELLKKLSRIEGIKRVFVRSGVRYDYVMYDKNDAFLRELIKNHISGQLKVAPEHVDDRVLKLMGKPSSELFMQFVKKYFQINDNMKKNQFLVPYFMSSHPGSDLNSAILLAEFIRDSGLKPEQVQDFYPTPFTLSTCMYYTGFDPRNNEIVYVPKSPHEKAMQRALIQYYLKENEDLVREALHKASREDLIGFSKKALVRPRKRER